MLRVRTCLVLAVMTAIAGVGLRLAVPVTPPDDSTRAVLRFFDPSNLELLRDRN